MVSCPRRVSLIREPMISPMNWPQLFLNLLYGEFGAVVGVLFAVIDKNACHRVSLLVGCFGVSKMVAQLARARSNPGGAAGSDADVAFGGPLRGCVGVSWLYGGQLGPAVGDDGGFQQGLACPGAAVACWGAWSSPRQAARLACCGDDRLSGTIFLVAGAGQLSPCRPCLPAARDLLCLGYAMPGGVRARSSW